VNQRSAEDVARGRARFAEVMPYAAPESDAPFVRDGVVAAVFGDLWTRDGLTTKERRLISITCVCAAVVPHAVEDHLRSALVSGDLTVDELQEFVLHFAYYAGWPRASVAHKTLTRIIAELGLAGGHRD
jgi:4-carboxymuconolactone decarboxylase